MIAGVPAAEEWPIREQRDVDHYQRIIAGHEPMRLGQGKWCPACGTSVGDEGCGIRRVAQKKLAELTSPDQPAS